MYVLISICVYIYTHINVYIYIYIYVAILFYKFTRIYIYIYIYIYSYRYLYVYVCIHICYTCEYLRSTYLFVHCVVCARKGLVAFIIFHFMIFYSITWYDTMLYYISSSGSYLGRFRIILKVTDVIFRS